MLVGPQSSNVASGCILNLLGCCESGEVNISEAFWLKLLVTTMIFSGAVMVAGMRRCFVLLLVLPKFCIAMPTSGAAVAVSANGGTTLIAVRRSMTKALPAQRTKVWEAVSSTPGSHACRGDSRTDNSKSYYEVTAGIGSLEACQSLCEEQASDCKGIEYNPSGRCEVWMRSEGIAATSTPPAAWGEFQCLRFGWPVSMLSPAAGGEDRACRGESATDNSADYYVLHDVQHLAGCKALCAAAPVCYGLEYGGGRRCEIWTRPIMATAVVSRSLCLRFELQAKEPTVMASYHPLSGECVDDSIAGVVALEESGEVLTCGSFPAATPHHAVAWLDSQSGALRRAIELSAAPRACQVLESGYVLVGSSVGLQCFSASGVKVWDLPALQHVKGLSPARGDRVAALTENGTVAVVTENGSLLAHRRFGYDATTSVELFSDGRVVVGAFTNNWASNPVQIARVEIYSKDLQTRLTQTWGQLTAAELDAARNMADTRIYSLAISKDEVYVYAAGESAGGNTIFRYNGRDLVTKTARDTGTPMWMAKSAAHIGYIARIRSSDGEVETGTFVAPILQSKNRLNTFRTRDGGLVHDARNAAVYLTGTSACCLADRETMTFAGQIVGGYAGSDASLVVFSEALDKRLLWTTFGADRNKGKPATLTLNDSQLAIGVVMDGGTAITTEMSAQRTPPDSEPCGTSTKPNKDAWVGVVPTGHLLPAS